MSYLHENDLFQLLKDHNFNLETLAQTITECRGKIEELENAYSELEDENNNLASEIDSLQEELANAKNS